MMTMPGLPSKKAVVLELLGRPAPCVTQVRFDPRREGVRVPAEFRVLPHMALNYAYGFTPPIYDLVVDDQGIQGTLTFGGKPCLTFVPWAAVFAVGDEDTTMAWAEDLPAELRVMMTDAEAAGTAPTPMVAQVGAPPAESAAPTRRPRPAWLKVV